MGTSLAAAAAFVDLQIKDTKVREGLKNIHAMARPAMIAVEQLGASLAKLGGLGAGIGGAAGASIFSFVDKFSPATMERFYFALNDIAGVLGEMFAPAIETATGYVRQFADWLYNLDSETKEWIVLAGGAAVAIGALGAAFLAAGAVIAGFATAAAAVFSILGAIGSTAFLAAGAVAALAAGITALFQNEAGRQNWENLLERMTDKARELKKAVMGDMDGKMFPKGDSNKNKSSFGMGNWMQPKFVGVEDLSKQIQLSALQQGDIPTRTAEAAEKQNDKLDELVRLTEEANELLRTTGAWAKP